MCVIYIIVIATSDMDSGWLPQFFKMTLNHYTQIPSNRLRQQLTVRLAYRLFCLNYPAIRKHIFKVMLFGLSDSQRYGLAKNASLL